MVLILYLLFPIFILAGTVYLLVKGQRQGLAPAFAMFLLSSGVMYWSIMQSSSSTAAIGILFIPCFAGASGFLVWAFLRLQLKENIRFKILGYLFLVSSFGICGYGLYGGIQQRQEKQKRNELATRTQEQRAWIIQHSAQHAGKEAEWLKQEVTLKMNDESFVSAALTTTFIDVETLEMLSATENLHILAGVINHQNSDAKLLTKIYDRNKSQQRLDYAFALNHNTPVSILEVAHNRSPYIAQILSKNTNVTKELLLVMSKSQDLDALESLAKHSKADCDVLRELSKALQKTQIEKLEKRRMDTLGNVELKIKERCSAH